MYYIPVYTFGSLCTADLHTALSTRSQPPTCNTPGRLSLSWSLNVSFLAMIEGQLGELVG